MTSKSFADEIKALQAKASAHGAKDKHLAEALRF
jgi:hypothetical protein